VDDVPETIDNTGAVEVDAGRRFMGQRVEARPFLVPVQQPPCQLEDRVY